MGLKTFIHSYLWPLLPRSIRRRALFSLMRWLAPRAVNFDVSNDDPVYVVGYFSTASGLGRSARLCLNDIRHQGRVVSGVDIASAMMQPPDLVIPRDILSSSGRNLPEGPGLVVMHVNAPLMAWANHILGRRFLSNKRIVGYWAWELPKLPQDWLAGFAYVDEIWVPSKFVRDAVIEHTEKPVKVVPHRLHSIDQSPRKFAQDGVVRALTSLNVASGFTRKNPLGAIHAFQSAFGHNPKAELIVKLINTKTYPSGLSAIQEIVDGWSNIRIVESIMTEAEALELYNHSDIYLSLHRSEGFGLPLLEAMEKGLHVIATNWSGNVDFMVGPRCHLVPFNMIPAHDPQDTYNHTDMLWADPAVESAAQILRNIASSSKN